VIFFDEIDALAPARGAAGDAGGAMDRIVSQLMSEIDAVHSQSSGSDATDGGGGGGARGGALFVLAATNRPDLLDSSLLRPGRFDTLVRVAPPETHPQQLAVLTALTRKFELSENVNLEDVASTLPLSLSGADLYALCAAALTRAIHEAAVARDAARAEADAAAEHAPRTPPREEAHEGAAAAHEEEAAAVEGEDDEDDEAAVAPRVSIVVAARHFEQARVELFASPVASGG
jgi:SpoVK/Ycf46/Vps4 family AAA+-type ATPase